MQKEKNTSAAAPPTRTLGSFPEEMYERPGKAKYLEENLAAIPDSVKSLCNPQKMAPGSPVVTYATYKIDDNGNISMMSGSTNDPDGKIARRMRNGRLKRRRLPRGARRKRQRKKRQRNGGQKEKRGWKVRSRCLPLARM